MRAGRGRTILVIEEQPYLWAFLNDRVARATAYVRGATPAQAFEAWISCQPWPWVVVGSTRTLGPGLDRLFGSWPVPIHWLGAPPDGLPGSTIVHSDWQELTDAIEALNEASFNGVRLLRNRGLVGPDGQVVLDVPEVEGLLAAPAGLHAPIDVADLRNRLRWTGLPLDVVEANGLLMLRAAGGP